MFSYKVIMALLQIGKATIKEPGRTNAVRDAHRKDSTPSPNALADLNHLLNTYAVTTYTEFRQRLDKAGKPMDPELIPIIRQFDKNLRYKPAKTARTKSRPRK